jgi:hypothetical protein
LLSKALAAAGIALFASAALSQTQAMIDARKKFFGPDNVDAATGAVKKDKVIFSWPGHVTGVLSLQGRVVMLDTYVPRLEVTPGRTPFVIKDLVDLKPEALFFGHGHGDHADNGAFIAAKTGATMYMTPEACGTAQTALTRMKNDPFMQADPFYAIPQNTTITCVGITTEGVDARNTGRPDQPVGAAGLHQQLPVTALPVGTRGSGLGSQHADGEPRSSRCCVISPRGAADPHQPTATRTAGSASRCRTGRGRMNWSINSSFEAATTFLCSGTTRSVR